MFCVGAGTGPLCDNIFLGFVVSGKGEGDTGEGGTEIDTDDKLGLALVGSFNLGSRVVGTVELLGDRAASRRRGTGRVAAAWGSTVDGSTLRRATHGRRSAHRRSHVGRIAGRGAGVDGRRTTSHLGGRSAVLRSQGTGTAVDAAGRARRVAGVVAGGTVRTAGMVHLERGCRRRSAERRSGGDGILRLWCLGGLDLELLLLLRLLLLLLLLLRYLARRRGSSRGDAFWSLDASSRFALAEPEALQAGVPRAHKEKKRGRREVEQRADEGCRSIDSGNEREEEKEAAQVGVAGQASQRGEGSGAKPGLGWVSSGEGVGWHPGTVPLVLLVKRFSVCSVWWWCSGGGG